MEQAIQPRPLVADPKDIETLSRVLTHSFVDADPVATWLISSRTERSKVYLRCFEAVLDDAFRNGAVWTVSDLSAVAVWYHRPTVPIVPDPEFQIALAHAAGEHLPRFAAKLAACEERRPTHPHHELAFLGVRPHRQGRGLGSCLLTAYHHRLDQTGSDAFLEASTERSRRLYERHGYRTDGPLLNLPGGGPPLWPMLRAALPPV